LGADRSNATDRTLIKALSRAYRWRKLLDDGVYGSMAEMADEERINRSYLSRTIRFSLLAPDIVAAFLNGTAGDAAACRPESIIPHRLAQQRAALGFSAHPAP
jgi:hypothetical protein